MHGDPQVAAVCRVAQRIDETALHEDRRHQATRQ